MCGHLTMAFLTIRHNVTILDSIEPFYPEEIKRQTVDFHQNKDD